MNIKAIIIAGAALVTGSVAVGGYLYAWGTKSIPPIQVAAEAKPENISSVVDMTLGAKDAPVTIIEYASYTCPHCSKFHATVFKNLKREYIDTGIVHFTYREVYFDRYGLWGSIIARCGGESKFFGITEMIYAQQQNWARGTPQEISENLKRIGIAAGLTNQQVTECMSDGKRAQTLAAWYAYNQKADNVRSTPSLVINGEMQSVQSFDELKTIIDGLL